jgi:hypothetical protein
MDFNIIYTVWGEDISVRIHADSSKEIKDKFESFKSAMNLNDADNDIRLVTL